MSLLISLISLLRNNLTEKKFLAYISSTLMRENILQFKPLNWNRINPKTLSNYIRIFSHEKLWNKSKHLFKNRLRNTNFKFTFVHSRWSEKYIWQVKKFVPKFLFAILCNLIKPYNESSSLRMINSTNKSR